MKLVERYIISTLIRDMRAAGYQPCAVWTDPEYVLAGRKGAVSAFSAAKAPDPAHRALTDEEVFAAIDTGGICTLHFSHRGSMTWGNRGVLLILGNGEDCISDSHCAKGEAFEDIVERIYDCINNGTLL